MGKMKILQLGAGSMGTRRLRDLTGRQDLTVALFDRRPDRLARAEKSFDIAVFDNLADALAWLPEALVISTPPDQHNEYIKLALERNIHHFCEENIWTFDYRRIEERSDLVCASSCSFHFLPVIRELKNIVGTRLGGVHAYQMTLSTYMPDWHPEEGREFYARSRNMAAGREMVPFELLWLNWIFGPAETVCAKVASFGHLENGSEDTWTLLLTLANGGSGQLTVLQACPAIIRQGVCFGDHGLVEFDIIRGTLKLKLDNSAEQLLACGQVKEVLEKCYYAEINCFVDSILGSDSWPISYLDSAVATATLAAAEKSSSSRREESLIPEQQPRNLTAV